MSVDVGYTDRAVDIDELRIFNGNLATGLLRTQESSARRCRSGVIGGGRRARHPTSDLSAACRPRDSIGDWIEASAREMAVDPEWGPTFHLGVLPLDDGGTAISLVASHCVADGLGWATAIAEAVKGESPRFRVICSHIHRDGGVPC